jgi:hypothetical protein
MTDIDQFTAMLERTKLPYGRRVKSDKDGDLVPEGSECVVIDQVGGNCMGAVYAWFNKDGTFFSLSMWE